MNSLILFLVGLAIAIFSHPKVMGPIMARLFNEGIVTPQPYDEKKTEIIKYGGANLGLFAIGAALMLMGILIK